MDKTILDAIPEQKDFDRAEGLRARKGSGEVRANNYPWESNGEAMANAIKDPAKLVRRAKAVVWTYGTYSNEEDFKDNIWRPFYKALFAMGFTVPEVISIEHYRHSNTAH